MKARKRLAPKYIVMAIALVALLAATVTGVTLFLKDDGEVSATQDGNLPSEINPSSTQSGEQQDGNEQAEVDGDSAQINENEGNEQTQAGETASGTTSEGTTGSTTSGTTSTGTTQGRNPTRDEIIDNIEETVVLEDRKVYEGLSLSWTTIKLSTLTTDIGVYKPELTIEKTAVLVNGEKITPNTTVREGDKITYEIKVSNLGNYKATNLIITDSRNVEFDGNAVEAGKTIVELEVLEPGKQATIYLECEVTKNDVEAEDNILNIAYVTDGNKTLEDDDNTIVINPNVKIAATKVWEKDAENLRPESITVQLLADGEKVEGKTLELNANNNWTAEFTELQKYQDLTKTEIVYSVEEVEVPEGYTSAVEGMTITNTYTEPTTSKTATKVWEKDAQNLRPESITVQLLADGKAVEGKTLELNATNNWTAEFTELQKYKDLTRTEIVYSVEEVEVPEGYTSAVEGMTITNTYKEPTVSKTATKVWEADAQNLRPESITVQLLADGKAVEGKTLELNAENNWTAEFTDLQKYKDLTRTEIVYSVEEVEVPEGYTSKVEGMTITNTYEEPTISKIATKEWEKDAENLRPASITVQLLADGKAVEGKTLELNANNNWTAEFTDLQKYKDLTRTEIVYSVEEVEVPEGYTSKVEGMTITNTYEEPTISKIATKVWFGDNASLRPGSITVQLLADGKAVEGKTLELNANNNWTAKFTELQKYQDLTRTEIVYSVEEVEVPEGYESTVEGMTITNTYTEPTIAISVIKNWEGKKENTLLRKPITVDILDDNGNKIERVILTQDKQWTASVGNLQKYKTGTRTLINYEVKEITKLEGYNTTYSVNKNNDGIITELIVTNAYEEPTVNKTAVKTWKGEDDSKIRPTSIEVQLYKDEGNGPVPVDEKTATLTANGGWKAVFNDLPKYVEGTIKQIEYSIVETTVLPEGYSCKQDEKDPMHIINTYKEPKVNISINKVWDDNNNSAEKRPTSIKIQLIADGVNKGEAIELKGQGNKWSHTFENLLKYNEDRELIEYTVDELEVKEGDLENYSKNSNKYKNTITITNTYLPPVLTVGKTSTTSSPVKEGDIITYQITANNTGDGIARNIVVRDVLDLSKVEFVEASDNGVINGNEVIWTIDKLIARNGTKTLTLKVKVNNSNKLGTEITNTATVDGGKTTTEPVKHKVETIIDIVEKSENITGTNMVIVLDLSASMNHKIDDDTTKLDAAKDAAEAFINKVFPKGIETGNQLSVVTFNYRKASDQEEYYGEPDKATNKKYIGTKVFKFTSSGSSETIVNNTTEAKALITEINKITLGDKLGTNMAAALEKTKTQVNALKALKPSNRNVVVFLGDGAPSPYRKNQSSWHEPYKGNVESNILALASEIKAIKNAPIDAEEQPVNTIIHTIGFGVTNTDNVEYTQCCKSSSKHSAHKHEKDKDSKYIKDEYGYYYKKEEDAVIAPRILQNMSSGTGCYYLSDNGEQLLQNFNTIFVNTTEVEGASLTANGTITKVLAAKLDTTKKITLTVNDVDTEINYSDFATNGLTYTESTKTITWDVSTYDANTKLQITYYTK